MKKNAFTRLLITLVMIGSANFVMCQPNTSARYCNPLPMITAPGGSASGDVTVIRDQGKYYMFCTGGGAWVSDDMLNWSYHRVDKVPVAPHVVKYNGSFYMCGNDCP